ncbi:MAG: ABC transporter substrate-binding protein [Alphaproteobacteria bacterium]
MTVSSAVFAEVPESSDPIRIVLNNWTSQNVLANVAGQLLERMGYTVEYKPSDTQLQFTAMANGDMDFQVEVWEGSMWPSFKAALDTGGMVDAGTHDAVTREEWWYPTYIEEVCPGLPDWKALDACADKFATAETSPKGRFVGPPADWGKHYSERISALGMNFTEVPVGQAATLWAELVSAVERKEPVVLFNWTPNFIEAKFEGKFVEFPEFDPACHEDPAWGMNPDAIYDCGAPKKGWLKKAAWSGMQGKWPKAYEFLEKMNFSNAQIAKAADMVDSDGLSPEEAATKWIEENEDGWRAWIPEGVELRS